MVEDLTNALDWVFFISTIAASFAFIFSREIVLVVFKRGAFSLNDTVHTAYALSMFALGIPFWCSQNIVARGFFAMKDTITPTIIGSVAWLLTLPGYYFLMVKYGVAGLASASTLGIVLHTTVLYIFLLRKTHTAFRPSLVKVPGLSLILGVIATGALLKGASNFSFLPEWDTISGSLVRMSLGMLVIGGFFLFAGLGLGLSPSRTIAGRIFHRGEGKGNED
jgi:putative peptidoglycan lipid II flippase